MTGSRIGRYALLSILMPVVVPTVLYCIFFLVSGIVLGNGIRYRGDTPYFTYLLIMPWVIAAIAVGVAWLSLRLWRSATWRLASFPLALSLYVGAAAVMWVVGLI